MNIVNCISKEEFNNWLEKHSKDEKECWICVKKGKPVSDSQFYYIDAVEVALCYGWIDSTNKEIDGVRYQRFSPRNKLSPWSELNKERCRRLIKLGLMTQEGLKVLPPLNRKFKIDEDIVKALKKARVYTKFKSFHPLYQRIRAYNVAFYKRIDIDMYQKALDHLITETKKGKMFGEWNDYGRLLDY